MRLSLLGFFLTAASALQATGWREDFADLNRWQPLLFPKISAHSTYQSVTVDGGTALRAESHASASGLVLKKPYDVHSLPILRFEWKVQNVYVGHDPKQKAGDDYPMRIYVIFPLDEKNAGFPDRLARVLYGQLPPQSSLNYVWSSVVAQRDKPYPSPYTGRVRMIPLEGGPEHRGSWVSESADVLKDYRLAFGHDAPPGPAKLAIMNDSDNTRQSSVSWLRALRALPRP